MATRSTIAVKHSNGKVSQIYCHWDGYIEHNGKILVNYYNSLEVAEKLVGLGDISSLGVRIEPLGNDHSFDFPEEETTVYYGRDRGEEQTAPRRFDDLRMYELSHEYQEYEYIFMNGDWFVMAGVDKYNNRLYTKISDKLQRIDEI